MQTNEFDIKDFFIILWNNKFLISSCTFLATLIGVIYSLTLPNIYNSKALLISADHSQSMGNMMGQYSGLAGLAGISMPGSTQENKTEEAIEIIKSFDFFSKHFLPLINLQDLIAVSKWDSFNNVIEYDKDKFDNINKKWIRDVNYPLLVIPSDQEAYAYYNSAMSISQDKKSSFISLSFKHQSPFLAKEWTSIVISQINQIMRDKDKAKASKSIEFLNSQNSKVSYNEVKQALSILLQEQIKSLMLIEASDDYVFEVIDSPIVSERKSEPKRSQIVIVVALFSFILSTLIVLFRHFALVYLDETQDT